MTKINLKAAANQTFVSVRYNTEYGLSKAYVFTAPQGFCQVGDKLHNGSAKIVVAKLLDTITIDDSIVIKSLEEFTPDEATIIKITPTGVYDGNNVAIRIADIKSAPDKLFIWPELGMNSAHIDRFVCKFAARCYANGTKIGVNAGLDDAGNQIWGVFQAANLVEQTEEKFNKLLQEFCYKNGIYADVAKTYKTYAGKSLSKIDELYNKAAMDDVKVIAAIKSGFAMKTGDDAETLGKRLYWTKTLSTKLVNLILRSFGDVKDAFDAVEAEQYGRTLAGAMMDQSNKDRNGTIELDLIQLEELLSDECNMKIDFVTDKTADQVAHLLARIYAAQDVYDYVYGDIADTFNVTVEDILNEYQRAEYAESCKFQQYVNKTSEYSNNITYLAQTDIFDDCPTIVRIFKLFKILTSQYNVDIEKLEQKFYEAKTGKLVKTKENYKTMADLYEGKTFTYVGDHIDPVIVAAELKQQLDEMDKNDPNWIKLFNKYYAAEQKAQSYKAEKDNAQFFEQRIATLNKTIDRLCANGCDTDMLDAAHAKLAQYKEAVVRLNELSDDEFEKNERSPLSVQEQKDLKELCARRADCYVLADKQRNAWKEQRSAWQAYLTTAEPPKGYKDNSGFVYDI